MCFTAVILIWILVLSQSSISVPLTDHFQGFEGVPPPLVPYRSVPEDTLGQTDISRWENIRLKFFSDSTFQSLSSIEKKMIETVLVPAAVDWLWNAIKVHPITTPLYFAKSCKSPFQYLIKSVRYCDGGCAENTKCGPSTIPEEHLEGCKVCARNGKCKKTTSPSNGGVRETDFIIYMSISDNVNCAPLAIGGHCQQEVVFNRPIAGYLSFCKHSLMDLVSNKQNTDKAIHTILHEIIHALVFSDTLFPFFKNTYGNPLGGTESEPIPLPNGAYVISPLILRDHIDTKWSARVTGPHKRQYIVTPAVKEVIKEHFNCVEGIGAELEGQGGSGLSGVHWEKRIFSDELMSVSHHEDKLNLITNLTLSLFKDSGWYEPDFKYSSPLNWGKNKGCAFINESCFGWVKYAGIRGRSAAPFCTPNEASDNRITCSADKKALARCQVKNWPAMLPRPFQYFNLTAGGTITFADYCPMYEPFMTCAERINWAGNNLALETFGSQSYCIEHEREWKLYRNGEAIQKQKQWGAGCYKVQCGWWRGLKVVYVTIGRMPYLCSKEGQILKIKQTSGIYTYSGSILCPGYESMCQNAKCFNFCSGKGYCHEGQCYCYPGYTGSDCSQQYSHRLLDCDEVTCINGSCVQTHLGFHCQCSPGYEGALCDKTTSPLPCTLENCSNHGECYYAFDGRSPYCGCYSGFTGRRCEQVIDQCEIYSLSPCKNGGTCKSTRNSHICLCPQYYSGDNCEVYTSPCQNNPCLYGGTCVINQQSPTGYTCHCMDHFEGTNCSNLRYCAFVQCLNGGTCIPENDTFCNCLPGFEGSFCETVKNPCLSSPCLNGGICRPLNNSFFCECGFGYSGVRCETELPCKTNPCMNNGTCIPRGHNEYSCQCVDGYTGDICNTYNICREEPCLNGGKCSIENNTVLCGCTSGHSGRYCEDVLPCSLTPCQNNGTCVPNGLNFTCHCVEGYLGRSCDTFELCISNPCHNNGSCLMINGSYVCKCAVGYLGEDCTILDPCISNPCHNNESCLVLFNGSYLCTGNSGYISEICQDVDVCTPNPCLNGGTCIKEYKNIEKSQNSTNGGSNIAVCSCQQGFFGTFCEESDPCFANPCLNNGTCHLTNASYTCSCLPGYTGMACEEFVSCSLKECFNGGTCIEYSNGTSECLCPVGYMSHNCEVENPCIPNPCHNKGNCSTEFDLLFSNATASCECEEGYYGLFCENHVCSQHKCLNNGSCIPSEGGTTCYCEKGYTGKFCEHLADPCLSNPCLNSGSCTSFANSTYYCECLEGYHGSTCSRAVYDPCSTSPCNSGECSIRSDNLMCYCNRDLHNASCDGPVISDCSSLTSCENGTCIANETTSFYTCTCPPSSTGVNCEKNILNTESPDDICNNEPCYNGGTCHSFSKNWRICLCPIRYSGKSCEIDLERNPCSSNPCVNGVCKRVDYVNYKCSCTYGYEGTNCEESAGISFDMRLSGVKSYVDLQSSRIFNNNSELLLNISFNSSLRSGLLAYFDGGESLGIIFMIYRNRLQLRVLQNNQSILLISTRQQNIINRWHVASLWVSSSAISIDITGDGRGSKVKKFQFFRLGVSQSTVLSIGGVKGDFTINEKVSMQVPALVPFSGCISHVILNGLLQNLRSPLNPSYGAGRCTISPCPTDTQESCQSHELCSFHGGTYACLPAPAASML